ncbi:MAG TPA: M50 family metallopeptidase [Candidatus Babeliales bacterium]|nr:M50 family metallopeptidase [Candidatus Babeliales bacterium]
MLFNKHFLPLIGGIIAIGIVLMFPYKILPLLLGIIGMGAVVAFHELGHFLFCKLFKIRTPSFSIGFGPRLFTKQIGDTEFAISAIPLGGYVEIAGSAEVGQGEQKEAYSTDTHSFATKPWIQKFLVMMGGIFFNIILSYFIFSLLYIAGMPKSLFLYPKNAIPTVAKVIPASPAETAGIQPGDTILKINEISTADLSGTELDTQISSRPNETISFLIERAGAQQEIQVALTQRDFFGTIKASSGIIFAIADMPGYPILEAIQKGIALTHEYIANTIRAFHYSITNTCTTTISGPVQLIATTTQTAQEGIKNFFLLLGIISLSLAVFNLIPIPILDGGQLLFYTIEAIIRRPIPEKIREYIHIFCWLTFLVFILYISYREILCIANPYLKTLWAFLGWE